MISDPGSLKTIKQKLASSKLFSYFKREFVNGRCWKKSQNPDSFKDFRLDPDQYKNKMDPKDNIYRDIGCAFGTEI